jgi:hypothetical protein
MRIYRGQTVTRKFIALQYIGTYSDANWFGFSCLSKLIHQKAKRISDNEVAYLCSPGTICATCIKDQEICGRHSSVSAFDVSIYDIVCHYSCKINLIN